MFFFYRFCHSGMIVSILYAPIFPKVLSVKIQIAIQGIHWKNKLRSQKKEEDETKCGNHNENDELECSIWHKFTISESQSTTI